MSQIYFAIAIFIFKRGKGFYLELVVSNMLLEYLSSFAFYLFVDVIQIFEC